MKKLFLVILICFCLCACDSNSDKLNSDGTIKYTYAKELIINESAILIDVRTQEEYNEEHINGAQLLTLDDINEDSVAGVVTSKDTPVIVYCASGNRSKQAMEELEKLGYTDVYDLGAISNWEE